MSTTHVLTLPENSQPPHLVLVWRIDADHILEIGADGRTDDHRIRYRYRLSHKKQTIFHGRDFCSGSGPRPVAETLLQAARSLLGYLTLRPGDVEADYFDEYTPEQLMWRDEFAEELSAYAEDRCCGYCGGDHDSPACFTTPFEGDGGEQTSTNDQFDGSFAYVRAGDLRRWDVLFAPVRQITDEPSKEDAAIIAVQTSIGPQWYDADVLVWAFRPADPQRGCDECGADPGAPCNPVTCCALAMLEDAAEAAREER
ncbi:hypothetical protein [Actinoallomurus sp. NPDC050550]|uniref:hypothetical protein n=1 Tax=Actinoallomurus sp. NPDC050550 TaxID=3154937 RepID=UPI0033E73EC2